MAATHSEQIITCPQAKSCSVVVTGTKGEDEKFLHPAMGTSGLSRRVEDSESIAVLAAEVAILFLFKVLSQDLV